MYAGADGESWASRYAGARRDIDGPPLTEAARHLEIQRACEAGIKHGRSQVEAELEDSRRDLADLQIFADSHARHDPICEGSDLVCACGYTDEKRARDAKRASPGTTPSDELKTADGHPLCKVCKGKTRHYGRHSGDDWCKACRGSGLDRYEDKI